VREIGEVQKSASTSSTVDVGAAVPAAAEPSPRTFRSRPSSLRSANRARAAVRPARASAERAHGAVAACPVPRTALSAAARAQAMDSLTTPGGPEEFEKLISRLRRAADDAGMVAIIVGAYASTTKRPLAEIALAVKARDGALLNAAAIEAIETTSRATAPPPDPDPKPYSRPAAPPAVPLPRSHAHAHTVAVRNALFPSVCAQKSHVNPRILVGGRSARSK
jgi:hypothetical protein